MEENENTKNVDNASTDTNNMPITDNSDILEVRVNKKLYEFSRDQFDKFWKFLEKEE